MNDGLKSDEDRVFEFERFRLDAVKRLLFDADEQVPLMPKAFDILLYLVERAGSVAEKSEIMDAVWPDTAVEENNLTQNISTLRRVLGEKHRENRFIVTVPGRGYKFVSPVRDGRPPGEEPFVPAELSARPANPAEPEKAAAKRNEYFAGRRVFAVLIVLTLAGLSGVGFLVWRDNRSAETDNKIESLAVLPFKPLVTEHRDESLELGMADSLIAKLSAGDIKVRPLPAVRRFNAIDQDPLAAGRALAVEAVLDGSIQILNDRVRISAKLIRVSDGKQLWAGQYNEVATDIFALQDSISEKAAAALQMALGERARKNYTENLEAYQLFAKGKFHASRLIEHEVLKGISYYEQAIAEDPGYALAYVELSNAYRAMVLTNDARPNDVMPKARSAAARAAELDDTLSEAYTALAMTAFWYDFDPQGAERFHRRALELDSNSAQSHFGYAHLLSNTGRHEEALAEITRARVLDPVSLITNALEGQILFFAGREDESLKVLQTTADMDPDFWLAPLFISRIYLKNGMWEKAIESAAKARDLSRGNAEAVATIGYSLAKAGRTAEARAIAEELEERAKTRYVPRYGLATVYNALGERKMALDLLDRSFAERDALMVFLKVEPKWDDLRSEPRFVELMKKMNFN